MPESIFSIVLMTFYIVIIGFFIYVIFTYLKLTFDMWKISKENKYDFEDDKKETPEEKNIGYILKIIN